MDGPLIVVASVMRSAGTTGVQSHMQSFAAHLTRQGVAHVFVTPFDGPKFLLYALLVARRVVEKISPALGVWWYRAGHALLLRSALRRVLGRREDCIVYAQCPVSADTALRVRSSPSQTVTMVAHFNLSQADEWAGKGAIRTDGRLFRAIRRFEADVLPRVDSLVFVSRFVRDSLLERIAGLASTRAEVIPNFVANPGPPGPVPAEQVGNDLIAIGTLEPRKNQYYLLDVMAAARAAGRFPTLTLVGNGPDRAGLERRAHELGLADQVHFAGFVAGASKLIATHRACIHVATMESFGITLIEALSHGRPIFAPAIGGMAEVFDDRAQGRVLPIDDAAAAARIVCDTLDDAAGLQRLADGARKRFLTDFESATVCERLLRFILATPARAADETDATRRRTHAA